MLRVPMLLVLLTLAPVLLLVLAILQVIIGIDAATLAAAIGMDAAVGGVVDGGVGVGAVCG